jgi:hypothetical protein
MVAQAFAPGTQYGLSAALTTNTTVIGLIVGVDGAPEMMREAIESTHSTSTNGFRTYIAGTKIEPGEIVITCQFDNALNYSTLFLTGCDTITVTFAKHATTCGGTLATTAGTFASACVWTKLSPKWEFESMAVITFTFKLSGAPTWTAPVV